MYCNNESQAKMMFHGAVIYYLPEQSPALSYTEISKYNNLPKNDSVKITEESLKKFKDNPVIINAFKRNQWKNPTIVADVTCSMYPDRKSTRLNSSHVRISYAVFCLKKKKKIK